MIYKDFYTELGKLLYAVAEIDGMITKTERKKLQDIIEQELVPVEKKKDKFGSNVAHYSEMEFDFLEEEIIDPISAFESFSDFLKEHDAAINQRMRKICIYIVDELAAAYYGTNKKEKILIEKLQFILKSSKKNGNSKIKIKRSYSELSDRRSKKS